jgi:hypothetical protein
MDIALILRIALLYPGFGFLAGWVGFVDFDKVTGLLTVDVSAASVALGAVIYAAGTGGTFVWSRWLAQRGGAT